MKLRIEINCDNAAFGEDEHDRQIELNECLSRILRKLDTIHPLDAGDSFGVLDTNGNKVGFVMMEG